MPQKDKLEELFRLQTALNNHVFKKQGLKSDDGTEMTMEKLLSEGQSTEKIGPNTNTNTWLRKFLEAMDDESRELKDELLWKWWSKDSLDMQNIRVEIVDQLHFWISLALSSGMDANKVFDIYYQKNLVNIERQEKGYNKTDKTEADNKIIE
ncbi:MAG: dUTPase [Fibrobacterales bacterium]